MYRGTALRFKVSAPAAQFISNSGAAATTAATGTAPGLNVLLHGDGGQSFVDFPNQAVQGNLLGVVILAPVSLFHDMRYSRIYLNPSLSPLIEQEPLLGRGFRSGTH